MSEDTVLPFHLPSVCRKKLSVGFDGGQLSSDAGVLLLRGIEKRLGIVTRLASCLRDKRDPDMILHTVEEMLRLRMFAIAAGYEDADDCDSLRYDPIFKMAVGRLPRTGEPLCSQPTMSRLENAPSKIEVARVMAAMVDQFCTSYRRAPAAITLDIDDTFDAVHGHQQLSLFNAHYDERCFLPIHIYEGTSGKPVAVILRQGKTPAGREVRTILKHVIGRIRGHWPEVRILVRGDSHYGRVEAMEWCEEYGVDYIFGFGGNAVLKAMTQQAADVLCVERAARAAAKLRSFATLSYGAKGWNKERCIAARIEATPNGLDIRYVVTSLNGHNIAEFPTTALPDLLAAFEVWQYMFADYPNVVSQKIFDTALGWLEDIETRQYPERFSYNPGGWSELPRGGIDEFEQRLRALILRAARVEPEKVHNYLLRVRHSERLCGHAVSQIFDYAQTLVDNHSIELAAITKLEILDDLPAEEQAQESRRRIFARGISYHDWDRLSIRDDHATFYPPSPLREPFASLFRVKPDEARVLVRDITNHAIAAWRQLYRLDREHRATPIPLVFKFPWGAQEFWGDGQVYMWPRGHWAPSPVIAGLMALEEWAFSQVEGGRSVDEVIRDVLEGHQSSSVLSIAVALALSSNTVSETTLSLATSQKIWEWDIARFVQESGSAGIASNLIGFTKRADRAHVQAVQKSNARPARHLEVRWLAQLFVINANEALRTRAQNTITAFPDALAFDLEEEKGDAGHVADKRRTAEIWSEWGKLENYRATPAPDGSGTYIQLESPQQTAPDVVAVAERGARMNDRLGLIHWAKERLESKPEGTSITMDEAVGRARAIDGVDLFTESHGDMSDADLDRSAVAAVGAAILLRGDKIDHALLSWCKDVTLRAAAVPQYINETFFPGSKHIYHPTDFAVRGLEGLILREEDASAAKEALLRLAGHPLEEISEKAMSVALSMWSRDPNFAWAALRLGARLSLGSRSVRPVAYGYDRVAARDRAAAAVSAAIEELRAGGAPTALPDVPPAWVQASRRRGGDDLDGFFDDNEAVWREPDDYLRWDFLPKVLSHIPMPEAMRDPERAPLLLDYVYKLLRWTLDKIEPDWAKEEEQRDRRTSELGNWRRGFGYFLSKAALELDEETVVRTILAPIFALDDEAAESLINPFADILAAGGIIDPPRIMPNAVNLMKACVDRVLRDRAWEHAYYRDGTIYGYDLPEIVRVLLFVTGVRADQSSRFANGDWRDVAAILPIVDPFVRAVGDVPHVIGSFLTLCETAVEHYAPEVFIDQIDEILRKQAGVPLGWHGTTIPSRIAALVHAFAERLQPLPPLLAQDMLRVLDRLVDMGDRRSAALQTSEIFRNVRQAA